MTAPRTQASASAPGSLMLFGEHAVLHGHLALCAAIDRRIHVTVARRTDGRAHVASALGNRETAMHAPDASPPFQFVMRVLAEHATTLPGGVNLQVTSEFRDDQGLGSSAAVTVAAHAALAALGGHAPAHRALMEQARATVRHVQGMGSGTDVAASILGGVVRYRAQPLEFQRIAATLPLLVAYSGSKEKTASVIARVEALRSAHREAVEGIYRAMDAVAREADLRIAASDWPRSGQLLNMGQGLMEAIGVSTPHLAGMIQQLRGIPGVFGAKISGSGLGDCVIALGTATHPPPFPLLPFTVSERGVEVSL